MKLPLNLTSKLAKAGKVLNALSPELCVAGSILFGIGCVVTACVATVKSEPVVHDAVEREEAVRRIAPSDPDDNRVRLAPVKELTKEDQKRVHDIRKDMALVLAKNFAVSALLGVVSIALNIHGHDILRRRLTETTLTLAATTKAFKEYRDRVIADMGKEKDQEYMHGVKPVKEVEINPETGEVVGEKTAYRQVQPGISQYARMFDAGEWDDVNKCWIHQNFVWKDDPFINAKNLRGIETEMNQKLVRDGFLFLNDVYRRLGLALSIDGQVVGWVYDGAHGDHAVSFGVFDDDPRQLPCNKAFLAEETPNALLDFNVDGPIINDLENFFGEETTKKLIAYTL